MTLDIINYTEDQLAALSAEKVAEIREAQLKKDKLQADLQKQLVKEKQNLVNRGAYPSDMWEKLKARLTLEYEKQVEILKESLMFILHYVADEPPAVYPDAPYRVDYSLSAEERLNIVRTYYQTTYPNPYELFAAFVKDDIAKVYVEEFYAPLYDYFYAVE